MILQIFGHDKCPDTRKAKMFFSERKINFQYINLKEKKPSTGEWSNIFKTINPLDLIDTDGKQYKDNGFAWKVFNPTEALIANPLLTLTPIIRCDEGITCGYKPEIWKQWKVQ